MFIKFPSIESFANVFRGQQRFLSPARVKYGAKIKLHGTNAGVRVTQDGNVFAQKRSSDITSQNDNCGFAAWVESTEGWTFPENEREYDEIIFYGEWAGKGVQRGDAVCLLEEKYFFIFNVVLINTETNIRHSIADPLTIEALAPDLDNLIVIPWDMIFDDYVDYSDSAACTSFAELLTEKVEKVGEQDPFIKGIFDIEGPGEGWVLSPLTDLEGNMAEVIDFEMYRQLSFKVKAEHHKVKPGKAASVDIVIPQSVLDFAEAFVTEARCEQALKEVGEATPQNTGPFLKWVGNDIKKESTAELEDAGLEWKQVAKCVNTKAHGWWKRQCSVLEG